MVWCVLLQTSSIGRVFCVDYFSVVTNVVSLRAFSLIMVVFGLGLTTFVTEVLARRFKSCWFDDVCNVGRPLVARPGPAAAHGYRRLALSASWAGCLKPSSPLRVRKSCFGAFFGRTGVVGFKGSCSGASSGDGGFTVAAWCALCAKKFALRGLMVGVSAKKFALHAQNGPQSAFLRLLGDLFRGRAAGGAVLGEFFRGNAAGRAVLGDFFRANRPCAQVL